MAKRTNDIRVFDVTKLNLRTWASFFSGECDVTKLLDFAACMIKLHMALGYELASGGETEDDAMFFSFTGKRQLVSLRKAKEIAVASMPVFKALG